MKSLRSARSRLSVRSFSPSHSMRRGGAQGMDDIRQKYGDAIVDAMKVQAPYIMRQVELMPDLLDVQSL